MPLFEYSCAECGRRFELLMREGVMPVCPSCRSERVEKQFSAFAVGASAAQASPMPAGHACGGCAHAGGPGACSFGNN
jgi:putative FmdB family regulatory protein